MGIITFNGITSESLGIKVWTFPTYETAEKNVSELVIPGRNGSDYNDAGLYKNTTRVYKVSLYDGIRDYSALSNVISEWVHSAPGYCRLEDSYEPLIYRKAICIDPIIFEGVNNQAAIATITFTCLPQRFMISSDGGSHVDDEGHTVYHYVSFSGLGSSNITNPHPFDARPIITVTRPEGSEAVLNVGNSSITMTGGASTLYIDSEKMDCYSKNGSTIVNQNAYVSIENGFPILKGNAQTRIQRVAGISSVKVVQNFWTL